MILDLGPYPAMTDSGVEGLETIPAHWRVRRLGQIGTLLKGRGGSKEDEVDEGVPCVRYGDLYTTHSWTIAETRSSVTEEKAAEYTSIQLGDVLFAASGESTEEIGKSAVNLITSRACCGGDIILFRPRLQLDPRFMGYAADCRSAATQKARMGRGFTVVHIYPHQIKRIAVAIPPPTEQTAIARFLDHATNLIERYIRAKEKLIALLEEQKKVIVHDAVTGRIDIRTGQPYPAYKPSGVEWLGEVPAHWDVLPLKRWVSTKITDGPHETPDFRPTGISFVSAEAMVGGRVDFRRRRGFISREQHEAYCRKCRPQRDDIFMCKSGATTGKVAIVETDDEFSVWSPLALIRVNRRKVLARLLFQILQSPYVQRQVMDTWSYGTQPNLAMGAMERIAIALPHLSEQADIARYLDDATANTSSVIGHANHEIELLREYRTCLIADVVTGKLDVRHAADELPEVEPYATNVTSNSELDADDAAFVGEANVPPRIAS